MDDQQLLRFSRQIMLAEVGYEGQQKIIDASVLVLGVGGLGSPVAMYLAAAGVGRLILCDDDVVELSNLQRQIIHHREDLGEAKVLSAQRKVQAMNPQCEVYPLQQRLSEQQLCEYLQQVDAVADCSDNFTTRFMLNRACVATQTPLVSGAAIKMEGQVSVFNLHAKAPCYQCLYHDTGEELDTSCSENGIMGPVTGIIGSIQAMEVLKIITGVGQVLDGRLLLLDAHYMQWREMHLNKDENCPVCQLSSQHETVIASI